MKVFFVNPPFKAEYGIFSRDNKSPAITKSGCNYYPLWLIKDNEGDNISVINPRLCELTGIYWVWKNLKADYIGSVHYKRYFTLADKIKRLSKNRFSCVLSEKDIQQIFKEYDLILPNKRKYYIETMQSHFLHLPYTFEKDFYIFERTLKEMHPEYGEAFDIVMNRRWVHMFNMFVMKKEYFDDYCAWMFPILLKVDKQTDTAGYTPMEARAVAYMGEFMLDIWLERNPLKYKEVDDMFMEKQNWLAKGGKFLLRKVVG